MRAVVSFFIFIVALVFIYWLMGVFHVIEQLTIGIGILVATLIMFIPLFIYNFLVDTPTRNPILFRINKKEPMNLGHQYDNLPDVGLDRIWWKIYMRFTAKISWTRPMI